MVRICVVKACRSEYYPDCGLSYHRFPRDETLRQKWLDVLPISADRKLDNLLICSKHFKRSDYEENIWRSRLKTHAVPSKYLDGVFPTNEKIELIQHSIISGCTSQDDEIDEEESSQGFVQIVDVNQVIQDTNHSHDFNQLSDNSNGVIQEVNHVSRCKIHGNRGLFHVCTPFNDDSDHEIEDSNHEIEITKAVEPPTKDVAVQTKPTVDCDELRRKVKILGAKIKRRDARILKLRSLLKTKLLNAKMKEDFFIIDNDD